MHSTHVQLRLIAANLKQCIEKIEWELHPREMSNDEYRLWLTAWGSGPGNHEYADGPGDEPLCAVNTTAE